jgi:hypothetical protein
LFIFKDTEPSPLQDSFSVRVTVFEISLALLRHKTVSVVVPQIWTNWSKPHELDWQNLCDLKPRNAVSIFNKDG